MFENQLLTVEKKLRFANKDATTLRNLTRSLHEADSNSEVTVQSAVAFAEDRSSLASKDHLQRQI